MTDRAAMVREFLQAAGWGDAHRQALPADASDRTYERLTRGGSCAIVMNAPPGQGDDPADFVRIARYLTGIGLSAPQILAQDLNRGFLLLEDFGDRVFARLLDDNPAQNTQLYTLATDTLIHLARAPLPPEVPHLTTQDWARAAEMVVSDYGAPLNGTMDAGPIVLALTKALDDHASGPGIFIHRDFHAENLILLPDRTGLRQTGILDFQLGQIGQEGYDLVSILQDARRDVPPEVERKMQARYAAALGHDPMDFSARYATLGAQRALRILGIFARQARVLGKPRYLPMMPRVWDQLQRNLAHPALGALKAACAQLPPPLAGTLQRLVAR